MCVLYFLVRISILSHSVAQVGEVVPRIRSSSSHWLANEPLTNTLSRHLQPQCLQFPKKSKLLSIF
jgi:hypothetical protein